MVYIMLGIIIFFLTFCVLGILSLVNEREGGTTLNISLILIFGVAVNVFFGSALFIIYHFFFK